MKAIVFYFVLFFSWLGFGQVDYVGSVIDKNTKKPVKNVLITCKANNKWSFTDDKGFFSIELPGKKIIEIELKHLSYVKKIVFIEDISAPLKIEIEENNLRLGEVLLFGKKEQYSEITLKREAIDNVQAFTPLEVIEQLPGHAVSDFSLNSFKNIVFRTAEIGQSGGESVSNKAFGTAILVDGVVQSNNENMQNWAPNIELFGNSHYNRFESDNSTYTNPGLGFDLREISVENIKEIEVVQGIPDAKYGDLTTGLVNIKTKSGVSPLRTRVSMRAGTAAVSVSKGIKISDKLGVVNISGNTSISNSDPKDVVDEFSKIGLSTKWKFIKNRSENVMYVGYNRNFDNGWENPNDTNETFIKNETQRFRFSNVFKYKPIKWLDAFSLNTSLSYGKQHSIRREKRNTGGEIVPVSLIAGIYEAEYTPVAYYSTREIEGKPLNISTRLSVTKKLKTKNNWLYNLNSGVTFNYSDNFGAGRIVNSETSDFLFSIGDGQSETIGNRPYDFEENVKGEIQFASYLQNTISKNWGQRKLNASIGLRLDSQNGYSNVSPRINTYYKFNKKLKIRGGLGLATKSPSLNSLYTGKQYYDYLIGDFRTSAYNVAYTGTIVKEEQHFNLKPTKSFNTEFGFNYNLNWANISLTGFHKKLTDGLTKLDIYNNAVVDAYEVIDNSPNAPTIEITGKENILYKDSKTINGLTSTDYGIEFQMGFKKIEALNLEWSIKGLYAKTQNFNTSNIYKKSTITSENETYGVFDQSFTTIRELFRFGSSLQYHIPQIGLLLSLRGEHFIFNKSYNGDEFTIYPTGYLDQEYQYFKIPEADRTNSQLYGHLFRNEPDTSANNNVKVTHNLHLRLSKDFTNGFRIDFYANNFLNMQPTYVEDDGVVTPISIVPLSFGMNLKYEF